MLLPLQCGGAPDEAEKTYRVLRAAEGVGGSASDDSGIDGLWRRSVALGLSAGTSATRRAFNNAFPFLATDLLPHYARTLGLFFSPSTSEADRRTAVSALWPASSSAAVPDIQTELTRIDARLTIEATPEAQATSSMGGRWFAERAGAELPLFANATDCSALAGPTTRYRYTAFLAVTDPAALTKQDELSFRSASRRMRDLVPSWVGFSVSVAADGFTLDESPLDWTVLGDG